MKKLHARDRAAPCSRHRRGAQAQTYPSRQITLIVPFPPGGSTDTAARILAEKMRPLLGQPVIIENVGGAGGSIAVGRARARARPTATPSTSASGTPTSAASSTTSTTICRRTSSRSG